MVNLLRPPSLVILKPETMCNLDCTYCYLPFRKSRNTMPIDVARAVAKSIQPWTEKITVSVCWHGGEPLTTGRDRLGQLMDCFSGLNVRHEMQTNATLIDDAWCEFFAERNVNVGVSIDGSYLDNVNRVDWRGKPAHSRAMRGLHRLAHHGHALSIIAVVSNPSRQRARALYSFALEKEVSSLGINIEEKEGVNTADNSHDAKQVIAFWAELAAAWYENPAVDVREINRTLTYIDRVLKNQLVKSIDPVINPLPT